MGKKFKKKKRIRLNKLVVLIILIYSFYITIRAVPSIKLPKFNYLNIILDTIDSSYNNSNIITDIYNNAKSNIFNNPQTLLNLKLNYTFKEKEKTSQVEFLYNENNMPLVYIYNSHQGETYLDEYLEEYNIVPNILTASYMLKEKLENFNIKTIVEENNILEYMKKEGLDHSGSYIASRYYLLNTLNKYNSIKLYIDIHRDAIDRNITYTTINDKTCAKVLFVIGLENQNYKMNLDVTNKINNIILRDYPTLTRGIMKKKGNGVNGIYNQDLNPNIILLEVGGNNNSIEEVNNTLDIISIVIKEYLNEEKQ